MCASRRGRPAAKAADRADADRFHIGRGKFAGLMGRNDQPLVRKQLEGFVAELVEDRLVTALGIARRGRKVESACP